MIVTSSGPRKKTARWIADHAIGTSTYVADISAAIALPVVQGPALARFPQVGRARCRPGCAQVLSLRAGADRRDRADHLALGLYRRAGLRAVHPGRGGRRAVGVAAARRARFRAAAVRRHGDAHAAAGEGLPAVWATTSARITRRSMSGWIAGSGSTSAISSGARRCCACRSAGIDRRWVGLVLDGEVPAGRQRAGLEHRPGRHDRGARVQRPGGRRVEGKAQPGAEVGHVTYSARGHTVGKMLAMAYVQVAHSYPGSRLLVEIGDRPLPATVAPTPFFDPQGARLRAKASDRPTRDVRDGRPTHSRVPRYDDALGEREDAASERPRLRPGIARPLRQTIQHDRRRRGRRGQPDGL